MPKRDPLLFGGSASRIDVTFLEGVLKLEPAGRPGGGSGGQPGGRPGGQPRGGSAAASPGGTAVTHTHQDLPVDDHEEYRLVERWREACRALTGYVTEHHPDLHQPPSLRADLDRALPGALDSPWVAMYGLNRGLALRMLAVLRQDLAPQVPPLVPPAASLALAQELWRDGTDWGPRLARIEAALDRTPVSAPQRVREAYGLSEAELARLFGVTRQAVAQWEDFPGGKRAKAATVLSTADLLTYRLKPGRLPMVARKPAAAYGGLTMLDLIAADRHEELLRLTRESFDLAATA